MATPWQDFMNWAFSQQQQPAVGQPRELVGALNSQRPPATGGITVGARPGQGSPRPAASPAPAEPSFADSLRERLRAITDNPDNRFSKLDNRELGSVLSSAASAVGQLAGPRVGPVSIAQTLAALSGGVSAGFDNVEQRAATQQHRDLERRLREAQIRSMEEKAAADAAEEQRRAQYLAGQSPETRALADAYSYLPAAAAGRLYPEPPKPTSRQLDLQAAGLEPGTPEYQKAILNALLKPQNVSTTNVNMPAQGPQIGTIPRDHQVIQNPETGGWEMTVIPGSQAERELQGAAAARQIGADAKGRTGSAVESAISNVFDILEGNGPGFGYGSGPIAGPLGSAIPGSAVRQTELQLDAIRANVGFNELDAMRQSSPTGGALGNVTERELTLLQSTMGSLNTELPPEKLAETLSRVGRNVAEITFGSDAQLDLAIEQGSLTRAQADYAREQRDRMAASIKARSDAFIEGRQSPRSRRAATSEATAQPPAPPTQTASPAPTPSIQPAGVPPANFARLVNHVSTNPTAPIPQQVLDALTTEQLMELIERRDAAARGAGG